MYLYLYLSCAFFKNASSRPRYYLPRGSLIVVERTTRSRSIPSLLQYVSGSSLRLHSTYHPCSADKRARDWSFRRFSLRTQKRGRLNDQRQVTDTVIFRKRTRPTLKEPPAGSQVNKPEAGHGASLVTSTTEVELRDRRLLGGRTQLSSARGGGTPSRLGCIQNFEHVPPVRPSPKV